MSLINDALKRAKLAQQKTAPRQPDALPLRPAELARPAPMPARAFAPVTLAVALAGGVLLAWLAFRPANRPAPMPIAAAPAPTPVADNSASRPPAFPQPGPEAAAVAPAALEPQSVAARVTPAPEPAAPSGATVFAAPALAVASPSVPAASGSPATPPPADAGPSPPPAGPTLPKLQGIFYRSQRPAALLNGKMVLVGSAVGEHRVLAISPHAVTLVRAGETNVLTME